MEGSAFERREDKAFKEVRTENTSSIPITKENNPKVHLMALEEENKKLKGELRALKDLVIENETLKKQYETGEKKAVEYYSSKYNEIKTDLTETKEKLERVKSMQKNKEALETQLYENKDRMAKILNYAVDHKLNTLAEELTNIYSSED
jgi:hypothetical protein